MTRRCKCSKIVIMPPFMDLTDSVFGRLKVVGRVSDIAYPSGAAQVGYLCRCTCGVEKVLNSGRLRSGMTKSCGCLRREVTAKKNGVGPHRALYNSFVNQAKWTKRSVDISYEEFLEFTKEPQCHYCGTDLFWAEAKRRGQPSGYNLDRKDATLGYTKDNCVTCCPRCNRSKSNSFSYEEWVEVGKAIMAYRERNDC